MALSVLLVASLVLACLPVSWGYRNGARSESCYDMLVIHEDGFRTPPVVPPLDCGSSCAYQLNMVGRVDLTVEESNPTTYQCGEVYHCKCRVRENVPIIFNVVTMSPLSTRTHHVQYN